MAAIPKKISERIAAGIRRFQPILTAAKSRDVGENDTVTIIKDMLAECFGYDKYSELTSEYAIRGTYCDLAISLDGKLSILIEIKAVGIELKESHIKQAVDYAANEGVEWVILTNGLGWKVFNVIFSRPIQQELVVDIDFLALNPKGETDIETLFLWCKEGWQRSALGDFHVQKQALSRFFLGAMVLSDPILEVIRREMRRLSPTVRFDIEQIRAVLENEVIKREVLEGEKADEARKKVARAANKSLRTAAAKEVDAPASVEPQPANAAPAISSNPPANPAPMAMPVITNPPPANSAPAP